MQRIPSPVDRTPLAFDLTAGPEGGSAPPVVLLHGSVLSRAIWRGLGYLEPLSRERPVVRVDLRGHGRSGRPHDPAAYTQEVLHADLLAVLDAAGITRAAVLGYSLGARVALTAALRSPERITRAVLLAGSAASQEGALESVFFPGVIRTVREEGMAAFCAAQGLGPDVPAGPEAATRQAFLAADPQAMAALFTATEATPAVPDEALRSCTVPALWMTGEADHPRLEQSRRAAELMPAGRFVPLPGRTHGSTLRPAGPVLEHVLPFLREGDPGA